MDLGDLSPVIFENDLSNKEKGRNKREKQEGTYLRSFWENRNVGSNKSLSFSLLYGVSGKEAIMLSCLLSTFSCIENNFSPFFFFQ